MDQMHTNANTELAKDYIAKRKIPQLFEALITGLMVHKPDDHIDFIIESLTRYKNGNQQLKWDAFITRKGGMKNILAPIKNSTDANDTSSPSSTSHKELSRPPKLDAIPPGKQEEKPKIEDRPQSPTLDQQHRHRKENDRPQTPPLDQQHRERKEDDRPQTPTLDQQHRHRKGDVQPPSPTPDQQQEEEVDDRPQSPTPEQQQQRKVDDLQHVKDEDAKTKGVLKGKPILFIGGGPGSGKGTQCEKMIEKYGFTHLSAGDLIRAAAQDSTTEKGRYFNEAMSEGKLISTEDILGLLKDAIHEKANEASGFLIDGFPRRVDQGIQFEQDVAPCDALIFFEVSDETMKERLIKRGETSGRIDDNEETITKRLDTFHEQTTPILGYYGKQGKLVTIDANREADEIFTDVLQALEGLMEQNQVGKQ